MSFIQANNTYYLTNLKGGSCIDLSGGDNVSIIGYKYHSGPNQSWTFESAGGDKTFNIKSSGSGQYLSVEGGGGSLDDGHKLAAARAPYAWHVEDAQGVDGGARLCPASDAGYCVDLSDHGNSADGTPIVVWRRWEGQNQVWKVQRVQ